MKRKLIIVFIQLFFGGISFAQEPVEVSPNGIFDKVFTNYGEEYNLSDIRIDTLPNSSGVPETVLLCSNPNSYFELYFELGSGMEITTDATHNNRRNVICQVFEHISQFITPADPNVKVKIWVRDIQNLISSPSTSQTLGLASAFHTVPANAPSIGGVVDNEIWKTINSGTDSYTNVQSPLATLGGPNASIYHGVVTFNFLNSSTNWHTDLTQVTAAGLFDLYSVALHEITHALGFASLIDANGTSILGTANQYFSRYDMFLTNSANQPLITNPVGCSMYDYSFNPSLTSSVLSTSTSNPTDCPSHIKFGGNVNQSVHTPPQFTTGTSLSHLEDFCHSPNAQIDDEYYVMSNGNPTGPNFMKRYLKPEERRVLCDIGYSVGMNYGSSLTHSAFNYNVPPYNLTPCPGIQVAGVNDGFAGTGAFIYNVNAGSTINISGFLLNDFNATSYECIEDVYGNGTPTPISATSFSYLATTPGLALVRYIPTNGNAKGNITYIFIYVMNGNCNPDPCNIVGNGGFENSVNCGAMGGNPAPIISCWNPFSASPDLYVRNCIPASNALITVPTSLCNPSSDTWNNGAASNDKMLGLWSREGVWNEAIQNTLSSPLQASAAVNYVLSFRARVVNNSPNSQNLPATLIFAGSQIQVPPVFGWYASTPTQFTTVATQIVQNNNQWNYYTIPVTNSGAVQLNYLTIINAAYATSNPANHSTNVLIDEVSILPASTLPTLNLPSILCINQVLSDLSLYTSGVGGSFSGNGVTNNSGTYSFDPALAGVGTHVITYSTTTGCPFSIYANITVVNSTLTISATANPSIICSGGSTLTATGASSYVWSPVNATGSSTVVYPTTTTNYTVTGTNAAGCTATAFATVNFVPCTDCNLGTTISGTLGGSPQPSIELRIPIDITIAGNITFDRNTVKVLPGVTITVAPGATLNIIGAHLYGCQDMWQGIVVQDGGTVNVLPYTSAGFVVQTSLIEDAMIALDYEPISSQQTAARMQIDDVTFNRNENAVRIQGYPFSNANTVFSYKNSLVTCRDIFDPAFPLSWHKTSVIKVVNGNPNPFLEPYITTSVYPLVNLKAPLSNTISQNGLWLVNVGSTSASAPYTYHSLTIGSPITMEYNVFDHVIKGISATNTNLKVINSTFQFPKAITWALSWPSAFISGVHAYKQGNGNYQVDIAGTLNQPNKFYGLETALRVNNYRSIQFEKNVIRSNRQITTPSTGYSNGEYGVRMYLKKYDFVNVSDNFIHNINKGVYMNANYFGNAPNVFVENNIFDRQLGSNVGGYAEDAIFLESLQPNFYGNLWVNNNEIDGVYRGITLNSWIKVVTRVSGNTINLAGLSTYTAPSHGIALNHCIQTQGIAAEISYNNIYGFTKNTANFKGIAFTSSPGYMLNCNAVKTTYSGLYFNGNCNPTRTYNNIMEDHHYGLVLDNGGVIGQQGDPNFPADNRWLGSNWSSTTSNPGPGNFKHTCLNGSFSNDSKMYVRQGSVFTPDLSVLIMSGSYPYTTSVALPTILSVNPVPPLFIPCHEENNPGTSALTTSEIVEAMEENAVSTNPTEEVSRVQTYRALDADTTLMDSSAILTTFYGNYENSNAGTLLDVEEAAGQDNNTFAQTTMNSVTPGNTVEASYKLYYEALLHFQDSLFDASDSLTLIGLAHGCPTLQGSAVIQAASLYNAVYQTAEVFENICPVYLNKSQQHLDESSEASLQKDSYSLYPIPNKGSFYLKGKLASNYSVTLLNTTGSIVHQMKITDDTNEQYIQTNLSSGTYIVVLTDMNDEELYHERVVIID